METGAGGSAVNDNVETEDDEESGAGTIDDELDALCDNLSDNGDNCDNCDCDNEEDEEVDGDKDEEDSDDESDDDQHSFLRQLLVDGSPLVDLSPLDGLVPGGAENAIAILGLHYGFYVLASSVALSLSTPLFRYLQSHPTCTPGTT